MATGCVDLVGFGQLGRRVAAVLREHGLEVVERVPEDAARFETAANVVVLALGRVTDVDVRAVCDTPGRRFRALVVGRRPAEAADLDCDAFLSVALSAAEIARVIVSHAVRTGSYRPPPVPDDAPPSEDAISIVAPPGAGAQPERTMELVHEEPSLSPYVEPILDPLAESAEIPPSDVSVAPTAQRKTRARAGSTRRKRAKNVASEPGGDSSPESTGGGRGKSTGASKAGPALSAELVEAIRAASRRIFGEEKASDWALPPLEDTPEQLVPREMLEPVEIAVEGLDEDPFDVLAEALPIGVEPKGDPEEQAGFVGTVLQPESPASQAEVGAAAERDPLDASSLDGPSELTMNEASVGHPRPSGGREGVISRAELMRLFWWLGDRRGAAALKLALDDVSFFSLAIVDGHVVEFEGAVAQGVVRALLSEGRPIPRCEDESGAASLLAELTRAGRLGDLELARLERGARMGLLATALSRAEDIAFELRTDVLVSAASPSRLGPPLLAAAVAACARVITPEVLRSAAGCEAWGVRLGSGWLERARTAQIEPEVVSWIEARAGVWLEPELARAGLEQGIPGVVWALWAGGAVEFVAAEGSLARTTDPAQAAREAVEAAGRLALDANYFAVVGVGPDAVPREIREAYLSRRKALSSWALGPLGLDSYEVLRSAALDAMDDAYEVLRDEELRSSYRLALGL